jgi:uncharacterized lipoprotein YddW (UPF0748 family)
MADVDVKHRNSKVIKNQKYKFLSKRKFFNLPVRMKRLCLLLFFIIVDASPCNSRESSHIQKAIWATSWEIATPQDIVEIVRYAYTYNYDSIFAEIRYRGDALYIPNRENHNYPNSEPRSQFLSDQDPDFDPLDYLIKLAHLFNIEVHGWFTTFVVTSNNVNNLPQTHIYHLHPEWITCYQDSQPMSPPCYEGVFLDPGIPEVWEYTCNVILDVVSNYDLDGVVLDYVRYPDSHLGYNPLAQQRYRKAVDTRVVPNDFARWREQQVSDFVKTAGKRIKSIDSTLVFSVTVFPELEKARNKYFQDWNSWLSFPELDTIYLMMYTTSDFLLEKNLRGEIQNIPLNKIGITLRAWDEQGLYPAESIVSKTALCQKYGISRIGYFSFNGMRQNNYFEDMDSIMFFNRYK